MNNLPIKRPSFPQPPDSLEELSNLITEQLKEHDCFDFSVTLKRLNAVKKIVKGRDLEYTYADNDKEPYEGIVFLVIGKQGADFKDHENRR